MPLSFRSQHRPSGPSSARGVAPATLIVAVAMWLTLVANVPLWRQLAQLPELANPRGLAFGLAGGVIVAGLNVLVLTLCAWRWTLKPVLALFLVVGATVAYFSYSYGVVIDRSMLVNALNTDSREVRDLLGWPMAIALLLLGVLPAWLMARVPLRWATPWRQLGRNALLWVAAALVVLGAGGLFFQDLSSTMRNYKQLRYLVAPLNAVYAAATLWHDPSARPEGPVQPLGRDARLLAAPADARPPMMVFVLGETARGDHFALNGYPRDTTPELATRGVVSYPDVQSCGTSTAASVPCMFSNLGRERFIASNERFEGLVDVLSHAGLAVLWLDNQAGGCKGVCDRVPTVKYQPLQVPGLCSDDECFDEVMLKGLDARIAELPAERRAKGVVVFLHQMGSHGPAYYKREPAAYKRFMPECTTNALQQCSKTELINAFDNTIVYTDHFLASTIDWLKTHQANWSTGMVYVSDHGESLGENNLYLHGLPYAIAPRQQKHPAWITWLSPELQARRGTPQACLQARREQPVSHDNYFHTALGLVGVATSAYDRAHDLSAACRSGPP